jgi:DNA-binding XRE family transcriptional regulator
VNNKTGVETNWVIPVPSADQPQYALIPWALYERLLAGSAMSPQEPKTNLETIDTVNTVERVNIPQSPQDNDGNDAYYPVAPDWKPEETDLGGFKSALSKEQMPLDALDRLLEGDHPVKVFRKLRGLTQKKLAAMTGLNATYLSQIETRKRGGSTRVYRRLAAALSVDIGDLID